MPPLSSGVTLAQAAGLVLSDPLVPVAPLVRGGLLLQTARREVSAYVAPYMSAWSDPRSPLSAGCVVAFRGVARWGDVLGALNLTLVPWETPGCPAAAGCRVAASFADAWASLRSGVLRALRSSERDKWGQH